MAIYVLSDVHGRMDLFSAMLQRIHLDKQDTLYILGDVIDRGYDGIALLQMIRSSANMILLMGNHEHMMMEYYDAQKKLTQKKDMIAALECITRWNRNHNEPTKKAFESLSASKQEELLAYIRHLPLAYPDVVVKDRHYYLVHANWNPLFMKEPIYLEDCIQAGIQPFHLVWDRIDETASLPCDKTLLFGHTITCFFQTNCPYEIWSYPQPLEQARLIGIDCGCASMSKNGRLACIRLDDLEVFYV